MSIPAAFPTYLSALLQLWTDKCRGRALPARRDFLTIELEPWLSELRLVAVRPEGMRFIVFAAGADGRRKLAAAAPASLYLRLPPVYRRSSLGHAKIWDSPKLRPTGRNLGFYAAMISALCNLPAFA